MTADSADEPCPHCGAENPERLMSRFMRGRSEDARIEEVTDRLEAIGEPESGTEMRNIVREMGRAMDEDMGDEMEEIYEMDAEGKLDDEE